MSYSNTGLFLMAPNGFSPETKIIFARYSASLSERQAWPHGASKIRGYPIAHFMLNVICGAVLFVDFVCF